MENAIVSISTPLGVGAISIVRMSGKDCLNIALKVFHCKAKIIEPRYMYLGKLEIEKDTFEECLMVYFKAPYSYTGEDLVEFHIHGGILLAQKVVELFVKNGCRLAEAGEFSKRAFMNGKITLDKAEAIIGEINAETEGELKSSLKITNGKLAEKIEKEQEDLKMLLAEIEVSFDYPEHDYEEIVKGKVLEKVKEIKKQNDKIIEISESGKYLKNGINVALVGKANVGKSSVLNALLGENRAIVTDIEGTTRDSLCESFFHKGMKINLIDTAGIRQTEDVVEKLGIKKSLESIDNADIVLFIRDGSQKESKEDKEIEKNMSGKRVINVINKTDKKRVLEYKDNEIEISALTEKNINHLKDKIVNDVIKFDIKSDALVLTNERHLDILKKCDDILNEIFAIKNESLDIIAMLIKKLWVELGKITGNTENEDIISLIFSKFCLGKWYGKIWCNCDWCGTCWLWISTCSCKNWE